VTRRRTTKAAPAAIDTGDRDPRVDYGGAVLGSFGVSGLRKSAGYLQEEFDPNLRGRKADRFFREMSDNSPLIGGALWAMEALVRQVEWRFDAPEGSGDAGTELADWYEGARTDMDSSWDTIVSDTMSMVPYGWAVSEVLYKIRRGMNDLAETRSKHEDGLFGWRDFAPRSQDSRLRWEFDREGNPIGLWQMVPTEPQLHYVPLAKCLHFRLRSRKRSPEGWSLLRPAAQPYHYVRRGQEIEMIGFERNVAGVPKFEIPWQMMSKAAPEGERTFRTLAEDTVRGLRVDAFSGIVVPCAEDRNGKTGFNLSLMSTSGKNAAEGDPIIQRHSRDMLIALLMQVVLLGSGETGSWSLASEFTDILAMALNAILRAIAEVITERAVRMLGRLNGFDPRLLPVLNFNDIEKPDMLHLAQILQTAIGAGVIVVDDELEAWFRNLGGMPAKRSTGAARPVPSPEASTSKRRPKARAKIFGPLRRMKSIAGARD
jgi:hypothetical protein